MTSILILGHGNHGKSDCAAVLTRYSNLTAIDSSMAAGGLAVWPHLKDKYPNYALCYADRRNQRQVWYEKIRDYNTPDKTRLARNILADYNIYVGMRDLDEFNASKHLFDHILWIDASQRMALDTTMKITFDPSTMHWIDNNRHFSLTKRDLLDWLKDEELLK